MPIGRRGFLLATAAASLAQPALAALPDGPVRLVVPAPPGAFNDSFARLLAERLGPAIGQPVVVDNKPGAGGMIGTREVISARPDGRTIGLGNTATLAVNPTVFAAQNFDPARDLAPIAQCARIMTVLTAAPSLGVSTLGELIAKAKAQPGAINYGHPGVGSSSHLMFERWYRVQMNTLEQLVVFLPALFLFASYVSPRWGGVLGLVFIVGRAVYARSYLADPETRSVGFALSFIPTMLLLFGALLAVVF